MDIGIKENGLIHISQIADKFVENALDFLKVGQEVKARVIDVDINRKRISLSLKSGDKSENEIVSNKKGKKNEISKKNNNNAFSALKNIKLK